MNESSDRARRTAWELPALAGILVVAVALRARELLATPLWVDEIYILSVARQPLHAALDTVARDIHPPLWFALTHFWIAIGGTGERWLKTLPLLCSLTGIVGAFALGRRLGGAGAGLVAALLLTLNTVHIHWSQQLEDYSLVWSLLTWLVLAAWSLHERPGRGTAAGLLVVGILALYADYLASFLMVPIAVWGVWTLRRDPRRRRWWVATLALLGLLFVPQIPIWARQFAREGYGSHFHWPTFPELVRLARVVSFGPGWMPLVTAALAALALIRSETRRGAVLILVACLPLLFATRAWPLVVQRDMLYLLPFVYVLVGLGLAGIGWRPVRLGLMALFLTFATRRVVTAHPWAEPLALRRVETRLRATTRPGDLLLHAEPHTLFYFQYHLPAWRNRLLQPPGERVPYFDTGLMIADSTYWTPDDWHAHVARGGGWNAMLADRAFVQYGIARRAGGWARAQFDSAHADTSLQDPPIHLWIGRPAASDSTVDR
jgi:hypothetical protein